jgi:hypothetical protein
MTSASCEKTDHRPANGHPGYADSIGEKLTAILLFFWFAHDFFLLLACRVSSA